MLVRFENLADRVDASAEQLSTQFVDVEQFAKALYFDENAKQADNVVIEEMALQGVYPLLKKEKIWWAKDDKSPKLQALAQDKNGFKGAALEPQRLRTFQISYNRPIDAPKQTVNFE